MERKTDLTLLSPKELAIEASQATTEMATLLAEAVASMPDNATASDVSNLEDSLTEEQHEKLEELSDYLEDLTVELTQREFK